MYLWAELLTSLFDADNLVPALHIARTKLIINSNICQLWQVVFVVTDYLIIFLQLTRGQSIALRATRVSEIISE